MRVNTAILSALLLFIDARLGAEQVEMQNGDRYAGKVISMTAESVVLQSEVLGKITLPRSKVSNISLGGTAAAPPTNHARAASIMMNNSNREIAAALHNLGANTNFIEQIRKQFLSEAGPEANTKYDELVGGLFSGKFDMNNLRAEAKAAADQIRSLKQQGGEAAGPLDSYLAVLENFLKESAPTNRPTPVAAPGTNSAGSITITHKPTASRVAE